MMRMDSFLKVASPVGPISSAGLMLMLYISGILSAFPGFKLLSQWLFESDPALQQLMPQSVLLVCAIACLIKAAIEWAALSRLSRRRKTLGDQLLFPRWMEIFSRVWLVVFWLLMGLIVLAVLYVAAVVVVIILGMVIILIGVIVTFGAALKPLWSRFGSVMDTMTRPGESVSSWIAAHPVIRPIGAVLAVLWLMGPTVCAVNLLVRREWRGEIE